MSAKKKEMIKVEWTLISSRLRRAIHKRTAKKKATPKWKMWSEERERLMKNHKLFAFIPNASRLFLLFWAVAASSIFVCLFWWWYEKVCFVIARFEQVSTMGTVFRSIFIFSLSSARQLQCCWNTQAMNYPPKVSQKRIFDFLWIASSQYFDYRSDFAANRIAYEKYASTKIVRFTKHIKWFA